MRLRSFCSAFVALTSPLLALEGDFRIHDPSTLAQCGGKFYTYGTGGTTLVYEGEPVGGRKVRRRGPGGPGESAPFGGTGGVIADQEVDAVSKNWPEGDGPVRMANYLCQAQQKWTITPVKGFSLK